MSVRANCRPEDTAMKSFMLFLVFSCGEQVLLPTVYTEEECATAKTAVSKQASGFHRCIEIGRNTSGKNG